MMDPHLIAGIAEGGVAVLVQSELTQMNTLHVAVQFEKKECVEDILRLCQLLVLKIIWRVTLLYILPLGTDPTFEYFANNAVETPLYLAVGLYDAVKQILDTCPSSSHDGPDGKTALHATVLKEASKLFLQHGQISQRKTLQVKPLLNKKRGDSITLCCTHWKPWGFVICYDKLIGLLLTSRK